MSRLDPARLRRLSAADLRDDRSEEIAALRASARASEDARVAAEKDAATVRAIVAAGGIQKAKAPRPSRAVRLAGTVALAALLALGLPLAYDLVHVVVGAYRSRQEASR